MGGGNAPIIDAIRLSVHSLNPMGPAYHESVHAFFAKLTELKQGQIMGVLEKAAQSAPVLNQLRTLLKGHPDIYFAGYTQDAQKEYAESELTMAIVRGRELKTPEDLGVEPAPFLNALGEAIGETRRHILDVMRKGDLARAEEILDIMDDVYFALVTFDYPDAITNGLRRTTDMVRGVLERTRSDLTITMRQADLEKSIASAVERIRT